MNRKKVRKLLDSVADQLTSETNALVEVLKEMKEEHEKIVNSGVFNARFSFHLGMISKINKAIRQVQA